MFDESFEIVEGIDQWGIEDHYQARADALH